MNAKLMVPVSPWQAAVPATQTQGRVPGLHQCTSARRKGECRENHSTRRSVIIAVEHREKLVHSVGGNGSHGLHSGRESGKLGTKCFFLLKPSL